MIKRLIIITLFILSLVSVSNADYMNDLVITGTSGIWTDSRSYSTLNAAVAAIGSADKDLYIAKAEPVTTLTIPSNIRLHFLSSGSINNSGQLTLNTKQIFAGDQQIFTGTGDIDFSPGSVIRSSWFSSFVNAINLTNDDYLTLIVSESSFITADCIVGNNINLKFESPRSRLTANAGVTLSNIKNIEAGNFQLFAGAGTFSFQDGTVLNLDWFARLRSALNWISTSNVTLKVVGEHTVDYNDNVQGNIHLDMDTNKGVFIQSPGVILTFASGSTDYVRPEWFGIDGTADDVQINQAITASSNDMVIKAHAATYNCISTITLNKPISFSIGQTVITSTAIYAFTVSSDDVSIFGINRMKSKIVSSGAGTHGIYVPSETRDGLSIHDLYFDGPSTVYVAQDRDYENAILLGGHPKVGYISNVDIKNCYFSGYQSMIMAFYTKDLKITGNTFNHDFAATKQIDMWEPYRALITDNHFSDSGGSINAIEIGGAEDTKAQECDIHDNTFNGEWKYEVINFGGFKSKIHHNNIYSSATTGVQGIQIIQGSSCTATETYNIDVDFNTITLPNTTVGAIGIVNQSATIAMNKISITNNTIIYGGTSTAIGTTTSGGAITNIDIINNKIFSSGNGGDGITLITGTSIFRIFNNYIKGVGRFGIYTQAVSDGTISGNELVDSTISGMLIAGSNLIVTNNSNHGGLGTGLSFTGDPTILNFSGNTSYNNTGEDFVISGASYSIIGNNNPLTQTLTGVVTFNRLYQAGDIDSSGGAVTVTVVDGLFIGQIITFSMSDATASSTVSVQNHILSNPKVGTFNAVNETWSLIWVGTKWDTLGTPTCTF